MKTFVPFTKIACAVLLTISIITTGFAQTGPGGGSGQGVANADSNSALLRNGLSFRNSRLLTASTSNLKVGAVYLFEDVTPGVDARLTIDSLVNGAKVIKIDDNTGGLGYADALQPEVQSGNVFGRSYAVFVINFYAEGTTTPVRLQLVNATALDIDGNATLKEFAEVNMGPGAIATYMSTTLDISLTNLLSGKFRADNVLGIERAGIDTTSFANMFTVSNSGMSTFTMKYGTITPTVRSTDSRQFSLYLKGFTYPNQLTLPVELTSFNAFLNGSKVDLKWETASEKNVSHFVVEKSLDGKEYSEAGVVFAYGNTSEKKNYSFTDTKINTSTNTVIYYRLRSVDEDAKNQYSSVRVIRLGKANNQSIAVLTYPNPVTNELRVTVPASWQGKKVSYEVLSNNGRLTIRTESGNSSQTETINVSNLNTGIYMVRVSCNGETAVQKIVKQ